MKGQGKNHRTRSKYAPSENPEEVSQGVFHAFEGLPENVSEEELKEKWNQLLTHVEK